MTNIQLGTISAIQYIPLNDGLLREVKADVDGRSTNWLPYKEKTSSLYKEHEPIAIGDQCLVFNPSGKNEDGFIDGFVPYEKVALPKEANSDTIVRWAKDGTLYTHNIKTKKITLKTPCSIDVETEQDITLKAPTVIVDTNLVVNGTITDIRGDLTNHFNGKYPRV